MREIGATNQERLREYTQPGFSFQQLPEGEIEVNNPTGGMVTSLPQDKRTPQMWEVARNARTREDWVGRRPGTGTWGVKPDSNPILRLIMNIAESGAVSMVRVTKNSVWVSPGGGLWISLANDLTGIEARFDHTRMFDWIFLANGEERIRVYRPDLGTVMQIPGAPVAATITNFADRIVAANLRLPVGGVRPTGVAWSGNTDPFDWTGEGSGDEDLIQGDAGFGDPIVRLFSTSTEMVLLRKRSIWHAERQPFAAAPMRFVGPVISGVGCDLPHTAVEAEGGIIFADQRTKSVYFYGVGARPQKISGQIDRELVLALKNLRWARGTYDPFEKEYHLGICTSALTPWINHKWVLNVERQAWSYDDSPTVSELAVVSVPTSIVTIDQLIGVIDAQVGTIDSLNPTVEVMRPELYKGTATGEVLRQSYDFDTDWDGAAFVFEVQSQNLGSVSKRRTMKDLLVKVLTSKPASITLEHSVNRSNWKNAKTNPFIASVAEQSARLPKKLTTGDKLYWRMLASSGDVRIKSWWARVMEKGLQR
jgi:hypothetical protein